MQIDFPSSSRFNDVCQDSFYLGCHNFIHINTYTKIVIEDFGIVSKIYVKIVEVVKNNDLLQNVI